MGLFQGLAQMMQRQRGHLFGWVPVLLACGIGLYFSLRLEPALIWLGVVASVAAGLIVAARFAPEPLSPVILALALLLIGFDLAAWRAIAWPVLFWVGAIMAASRGASLPSTAVSPMPCV